MGYMNREIKIHKFNGSVIKCNYVNEIVYRKNTGCYR